MASKPFSGRIALVTGAASGIGAATARWLADNGAASLVLVDLDAPGLEALDLPCPVHLFAGDVADEALWTGIEAQVPRIEHALINAGIADGAVIVAQEFAAWRRMMAVNLDGSFLALRAALRIMARGQGPRSAVLTSSVVGIKPVAMTAAYGSGKAAIAHLARIAAAEHAKDGIRVNAVAPGRVETAIWTKTAHFAALAQELGSEQAALEALREQSRATGEPFATSDQLAAQIGFLLSDAAANITGTVLVSDGGYSL